ncbi:MAG: class I SAM-dependent methyltransferase [Methylacidiphilales bacterium]|nr:class I SAM-dependent methyltransferase [Candidatus Methylacidiphilales bacterium]
MNSALIQSNHPENLSRRKSYIPSGSQELFIVPLLQKRIQAAIDEWMKTAPDHADILDAGCGEQPWRNNLEEYGAAYYSLDVGQNSTNTVHWLTTLDADGLPPALLAQGPFDFILCTEVLEHVADWENAFANLAILLKCGGTLLLTCPHFYPLHEEPHDYWRPTRHAVEFFTQRHGLTIHTYEALGNAWDIIGTLLGASFVLSAKPTWTSRLAAKTAALFRNALWVLLSTNRLQNLVQLESTLYLSNFWILTKK